jgi:hypothetical protein
MAFGNGLCQAEVIPADNNYCGGYAMCAVLSDLKKGIDFNPISVYNEILGVQRQQLNNQNLQDLIEMTKRNDTDIILPSSLVLFAHSKRLEVELLYAKDLGFSSEIIQAERQRCTGMVTVRDCKDDVMQCFSDDSVKYGLVLVGNHNHWVAVKRKSSKEKGFAVYDPATGERANVMEGDLKEYLRQMDELAGELVITLKPE